MKWLVLLLLVPAVTAGPSLSLLVHHPYPDASDPFGFPYQSGIGYYGARYSYLDEDRNGFDFPHMVMDGVLPVEGLPEGGPFVATNASYQAAYAQRTGVEAPVQLTVESEQTGDEGATFTRVSIEITPTLPMSEQVPLWAALVEDNVFFDAGRLGNGVTNHRMVVREIMELGEANLAAPTQWNATWASPDDLEQWYVVVWLQEDANVLQFDANEVIQATTHPLRQNEPTVQDTKGVLMQLYSATWCDTCLFGDLVSENMLEAYGPETKEIETGYLQNLPIIPMVLVGLFGAAFLFFWPMRREP